MEARMSRRLWLALAGLAALVLFILVGSTAAAWMSFRSGEAATVSQSEIIDSSLWTTAKNIDIAGTVNGDLFCAGETVNISGTIKGDVICAAKSINISGTVEGSLRLAALTVDFSGTSAKSATVAGENINIQKSGSIGIDASLFGTSTNISGKIGRDLAGAGSKLDISGQIGRDISSKSERINLLSGASVAGNIDYTSKRSLIQAEGVQIGGKITQRQPKASNNRPASLLWFGSFAIPLLLMLLITSMAVFALFPRFVLAVTDQGRRRPFASLGIGILASMVMPIFIFLLAITIIGIPLAILLLLVWLLINLTSGIFSAFWLGRTIWRHYNNVLLVGLAGSLLLLLLYVIPVIGLITLVLAVWFGQGMTLLELYSRYRRPDYKITQPKAARKQVKGS